MVCRVFYNSLRSGIRNNFRLQNKKNKKMIRSLVRLRSDLYYFEGNEKIQGPHFLLSGDCSHLVGNCTELHGDCTYLYGDCTNLRGDCTGLTGDCTNLYGNCNHLRGNCSGLRGDCTDLIGDLDSCDLTTEDRMDGVNILHLINSSKRP